MKKGFGKRMKLGLLQFKVCEVGIFVYVFSLTVSGHVVVYCKACIEVRHESFVQV